MTSTDEAVVETVVLKSLSGREDIEILASTVVGRGADSDVVIDEERLSRKHARLDWQSGQLSIEDLGSANGSFVNGDKATGSVSLCHGDVVKLDSLEYRVCLEEDGDSTVFSSPAAEQLEAKTQSNAAPKSWALDDSRASDGTEIMSLEKHSTKAPDEQQQIADTVDVEGPTLICVSGDLKGKVYGFSTRDKLSQWEIGRAAESDLAIDEPSISNSHAQLVHEGRRWKLTDLMSANGSFVNGSKVLSSYLSSGDKLRLGQIDFIFKLPAEAGPAHSTNAALESAAATKPPMWLVAGGGFVVMAALLYFLLF